MKKLSIYMILFSCLSSLNAMNLFDSWNVHSSKSSLTDEEESGEPLPHLQAPNLRNMLINSILNDNDTGVVLALIDYPDLNVPGKKYGRDDPPLCVAAGQGHRTVLESLLANGAVVNVCDGNGDSPLHYAARFGHLRALKVLVQYGASLETTNMWGQTVLHQALEETPLNIDLIRWLLKKGADVNAQDEEGKSGAHYACMHDREDLLELLRARDDVLWNLADEDGMLPNEMPLLAYYICPPSLPPLPPASPEQCTIVYANLDDLLGYFDNDRNVEQNPEDNKADSQEDVKDTRTIHTHYYLLQLEVDDADDEFNSSDDAFETAHEEVDGPPVLLINTPDNEQEISWDSE